MFLIEDYWHAEWIGEFPSRAEAVAELHRLASLAWDEEPNRCPCTSWRTCSRRYHLIQFDTSEKPYRTISDDPCLEVSDTETKWLIELNRD